MPSFLQQFAAGLGQSATLFIQGHVALQGDITAFQLLHDSREALHLFFEIGFFGHVGVFPVARGRGDRSVLDGAIESVRGGRGMLIFPEGTRNKEGPGLLPLKSGAFVVAAAAGADIVPCRIIYKGGHQHLFCTVTVIFGQPIPIESLDLGGEHSASKLREAKKVLAGRLEELYEQNRRYE